MKWDAEIFNRTAAYIADNNVGLNVDIPQLKQFSEIELYGSFSNKEKVLKSIYRYIRLPTFGQNDVACDFLQLAASKNNTVTEKALDESSKYLDAAYSSNEAYCAFQVRLIITFVIIIILLSSLQQHKFPMVASMKRNISCDAMNREEYPYEMCKLRYSQKRFFELSEIYKYEPIALLSVDRYIILMMYFISY